MSLAADTTAKLAIALVSPAAATDLTNNINTPTPGATNVASTSATALSVAVVGTTNPGFVVDESTASAVTGIKVKAAAVGGGVAVTAITSGTNEALTIDAAAAAAVKLNSIGGTGAVQVGGAASGANATGLTITPNSAGSGLAIAVVSTGNNEGLTLNAKGSGTTVIGGLSTGLISLGRGSVSTVIESGAKTSIGSGNQTATAAQLLTGYITGSQSANTVTLDTGTNLDAAIPGVATGDTFYCTYQNTGGGNGTITGASGSTIKGSTGVVATNKCALMQFVRTGAAAWDVVTIVTAV